MSTMFLREQGATARLYRFSRRMWAEFKGGWEYDNPYRTDLCTLIRYIFVLMPLVFAANLLALGFLGWALLTFVYLLWLNLSVTGLVVAMMVGIALVVLLFLAALNYGAQAVVLLERSEVARAIGAVYRAKKEKICPIVEIGR